VKAFTDGGGSITAGSISFTSNANDNLPDGSDCGDVAACAHALAGAISLGGSVAFTNATGTDSPDVHTYVSKDTQLTATCAINVVGNVKQKARGETGSVSISLGFAGGVTNAKAIAEGATESYVNGVITQAGTVTV